MKRSSVVMPVLIAASLLLSLFAAGMPAAADSPESPASDRFIVHFKTGTAHDEMQRAHSICGSEVENVIPQLGAYVVKLPQRQASARLAAYRASGAVAFVEPDYAVSVSHVPNDPILSQQWGLAKVQAQQAWDITRGSRSIPIAILDTGIDLDHVDLASKIIVSQNFSSSATPDDAYGHGTHVAGIAAAATANAAGVAGLGYESTLMNVKVLGDNGVGYYSQIAQGIIWAADSGAKVINLSIGGGASSLTLQQAVDYAWAKGVVVVSAAGNGGSTTPSYPAYYDNAIAVAASDPNDRLYSFSNYGAWVDVAAPGSAISTLPGNSYGVMSGTSMASPFVAGLAGLTFSVATDRNGDGRLNDEVRSLIQVGADYISADGAGSGRINAYRTLSAAVPPSPPPPTTGAIAGTVTDSSTGRVLAGASVGNGSRTVTTDSNGRYAFPELPPGSYTLTASATGYVASARTLMVAVGQTVTANFALSPVPPPQGMWVEGITFIPSGPSLYIKVRVVNPQPVAGAGITLSLSYNGRRFYSIYNVSNAAGEAYFWYRASQTGTYTATVLKLQHSSYPWDKARGVTSATYVR